MKLKINKACDLSSISVLPPQSRRASLAANAMQSSQLRSQQSQQSFSQGPSSQPVSFSQFSQSSFDDAVVADQRFGSQGRENSTKKASCLPITTYSREDSQMQVSASSNFIRKWNPTSVPEQRCQVSEQLEHRLGVIETSLSRFGMILDSIQSDLMQVNKGTKEVLLGTEGIRQKLMLEDTSLQLLNRAQEDIKASIDGGMKSLADQVSRDKCQDKLQQILWAVSTLPEKMEASLLRLQNEIRNTLTKEIQSFAVNLKILSPKSPLAISLPRKLHSCCASPPTKLQPPKKISSSQAVPEKVCGPSARWPKIEVGHWNSVRPTLSERALDKQNKRKRFSPKVQETTCQIVIESDHSDEEIDGLFSSLVDKEKTGSTNMLVEDTKRETERIMKKARRQRRKYCNPIIIS